MPAMWFPIYCPQLTSTISLLKFSLFDIETCMAKTQGGGAWPYCIPALILLTSVNVPVASSPHMGFSSMGASLDLNWQLISNTKWQVVGAVRIACIATSHKSGLKCHNLLWRNGQGDDPYLCGTRSSEILIRTREMGRWAGVRKRES